MKKSKRIGDVQRIRNLWTSSFYAQGRTDEIAADAACARMAAGEISMDRKDRSIMQVFVGEVRDCETDSRTPTKMGKDWGKYPLLRVKKFPIILYAYYRLSA